MYEFRSANYFKRPIYIKGVLEKLRKDKMKDENGTITLHELSMSKKDGIR